MISRHRASVAMRGRRMVRGVSSQATQLRTTVITSGAGGVLEWLVVTKSSPVVVTRHPDPGGAALVEALYAEDAGPDVITI